ncbi:MAG: alpha/beta fold hydrolase [Dehalococcoidia bacterium]|nr:alpha/beta fold hydrolase [Dehalococcoidia bacterium]
MRRAFLLVFFLVLTAFACSSHSRTSAQASTSIDWKACGSIECATFAVPLDYANPGGKTIDLSLIRIKARKPDQRIGVLLANPGGPGASANEFVRIWRNLLAGQIRDRFDIVSFDPRGVGESSPILCHDNLQELVAADPDPDTDAEWQQANEVARQFAEGCEDKYGDILPHLGTKNVARDMDRIREALGETKLNYVGYSYGTTIGGVYADMFPGNVRAMVLDGGTDLSLSFEDVNRTQMIGFERAFNAYLADCAAKKCALAANGADPKAAVQAIMAAAEAKPLPAPGADRPAGPGEVELGIMSAMYSKQTWAFLTRALQDAQRGDGTGLVRLTDNYLQRESNGDYPNLMEANAAVNYVDEACPKDPEAYRKLGDEFAKDAPTFGASAATAGLVCAYWEAKPDPLTTPKAAGAPPIIVIATSNDPATPYEWGKALSEQLSSGVLLTHRGEGHTIYAQGNSCIDDVVNAYLLTLAVPAAGTSCGNGPPPPGQTPGATASASPPSEATRTPTPAAQATREATPAAPDTGGDRDNGSGTVAVWAVALVLAGAAIAALGALAAARRR